MTTVDPNGVIHRIFTNSEVNGTEQEPTSRGYASLLASPPAWNQWLERRNDVKAPAIRPDLSGVAFSNPLNFSFLPMPWGAIFKGTTFAEGTTFDRAEFGKTVDFSDAVFLGQANFSECHFRKKVSFSGAKFCGVANFSSCKFEGAATFEKVNFCHGTSFLGATFDGEVEFVSTRFTSSEENSSVSPCCEFERTIIGGHAYFKDLVFPTEVNFRGTTFREGVHFRSVTFDKRACFENAVLRGTGSTFARDVQLKDTCDFHGAQLHSVRFDGVEFGHLANFTGATLQDVHFTGSHFCSTAAFSRTTFSVEASFREATFCDSAEFSDANFGTKLDFCCAVFEKNASFDTTKNIGFPGVDFSGVAFHGEVDFSGRDLGKYAYFGKVDRKLASGVRRNSAVFRRSPKFHRCSIPASSNIAKAQFLDFSQLEDAENYRTLKKLMNEHHDYQSEAIFSRLEMRAENVQDEHTGRNILHCLYWHFSKYGSSATRPLYLFFGSLLTCGALYAIAAGLRPSFAGDLGVTMNLISFTLLKASPFSGANATVEQLWQKMTGASNMTSLLLISTEIIHRVLSLVSFFLVGLSLRNRFRIK